MVGTLRINVIVGLLAFLITFALSVSNNLFLTTLLKSFYSFMTVFVLTFGFRWVLGTFAGMNQPSINGSLEQLSKESQVGQQLDVTTPDEDIDAMGLLKTNLTSTDQVSQSSDGTFAPLNPPKLTTKNSLDPEHLAEALRRMSED